VVVVRDPKKTSEKKKKRGINGYGGENKLEFDVEESVLVLSWWEKFVRGSLKS